MRALTKLPPGTAELSGPRFAGASGGVVGRRSELAGGGVVGLAEAVVPDEHAGGGAGQAGAAAGGVAAAGQEVIHDGLVGDRRAGRGGAQGAAARRAVIMTFPALIYFSCFLPPPIGWFSGCVFRGQVPVLGGPLSLCLGPGITARPKDPASGRVNRDHGNDRGGPGRRPSGSPVRTSDNS
jgi:hypothetical protein